MRVTAAHLTALCIVWCQHARADDAPAPTQTAAPTNSAPTAPLPPAAEKSAAPTGGDGTVAAPGAQQKAAPQVASPMINPGVTVAGTKPEMTPDEKELLSRGYKLEMRHGEKYFCRREQQLGSRFEIKSCDTAQSIQAHRLDSQETVREIESNRPKISN
jgi:hypothetical protein